MNFAGGFRPLSYEQLFGQCEDSVVSRENWGISSGIPQFPVASQPEREKRRKTTSIVAKKRARMSRGDENIVDSEEKKLAGELLDQIQNSPGLIMLKPESSKICPIPPNLQVSENGDFSVNRLQEGQMHTILNQNPQKFMALGLPTIEKGKIETTLIPRSMSVKAMMENLKNPEKSKDDFVGFSNAIANFLRRSNPETVERITQQIAEAIEKEISK